MKALTAVEVGKLVSEPRDREVSIAVGGKCPGLKIRIKPASDGEPGTAAWTLRYRVDGGQRRYTFGKYPGMSLAAARKKGLAIVASVEDDADPSAERKETRATTRLLEDLVSGYLKTAEKLLRAGTLRVYRPAILKFTEWCRSQHVRIPAELSRARLSAFRDYLATEPKSKGTGKRSGHTVNSELRAVSTMLNKLRRDGSLPNINRDMLRDCLSREPTITDPPPPLRQAKLRKLLCAATRHDAATFKVTRWTVGEGRPERWRHQPIAAFVAVTLLSGMRRGEALELTWDRVDLNDGVIELRARSTKTKRGRVIDLNVSPALRRLLTTLQLRAEKSAMRVFPGLSATVVTDARARLRSEYGAPLFAWSKTVGDMPTLRSTCASYLNSAPSVFGAAAHSRSAAQLGHTVETAERHYVSTLRVPRNARTLEAAMGIEAELDHVIERVTSSARAGDESRHQRGKTRKTI